MYLRVTRVGDGALVASRARAADTFFARFRGLMLAPPLGEGEGLLIEPCTSIHMMFMRFPIDALFLSGDDRAVGIYHRLRPWIGLSGWHRDAAKVLELPAGLLDRLAVRLDEHFRLERMT